MEDIVVAIEKKTCEGITVRGTRCKRNSIIGMNYCRTHSHANTDSKKLEDESEHKCLHSICNSKPVIETPNGKCCKRHSKLYKLKKPDECSICMEEIGIEETPLKCGHWFHMDCLLNCVKLSCPVCRADIKLSRTQHKQWRTKHAEERKEDRYNRIDYIDHYINNFIDDIYTNDIYVDEYDPFSNINVDLSHVAYLENNTFSIQRLPDITASVATVYHELNTLRFPEEYMFEYLMSRGYTLV